MNGIYANSYVILRGCKLFRVLLFQSVNDHNKFLELLLILWQKCQLVCNAEF